MTPRTVVFDLGKVLVDFDYSLAARKIAARCRLSVEAVQNILDHSPLLFRLETGQMTTEQFFEAVRTATNFSGTQAEFYDFFADIFTEMPEMVALHARLRAAGVPTFAFSNTNDIAISHIRRKFPFFSQFDGYILSYQQGVMKPNAKIYEAVERMTGRCSAEILYLDDRRENVEAGAARGWQVILQELPEKTRAMMRKLGLPV